MFVKPSMDGKRLDRFEKVEFIGYDQVRMNTPQLMELHTKSLLELLKFMREERRNYFSTMATMKKASSELPEYKPVERMSADEYEMMTRKCFVVESILNERMGYIPKKITENLLINYEARCQDPYNQKVMSIKKPEIEKERGVERGISR
jgi:hypothetical protein